MAIISQMAQRLGDAIKFKEWLTQPDSIDLLVKVLLDLQESKKPKTDEEKLLAALEKIGGYGV